METFIRLITYFWPAYLVLAVPFFYFLNEPFTVAIHQMLAVLLLLFLVGGQSFRQANKLSQWFFRLTLLWLAALGISAFFSVDPSVSVPGFVKVIGLVALAAGIRYLGAEQDLTFSVCGAAVIAGLLHGWMAGTEYFEAAPIPASWVDPEMRGLIPTRCAGVFYDPNIYGAYLAGLIPLTLGGLFSEASNSVIPFLSAAGYFGASVALFTTFSRTGYLGGLAAIAVFFFIRRPDRKITRRMWLFILASALILLVFFLGPFKYRFFSIANTPDMTLSQRTLINRGVIHSLEKIPLFGFGLHTFNQVYPQLRIVGGDYPFNAHNELLHTLIEAGPIAASLLGLLVLLLGVQVWTQFRRPSGEISGLTAAGSGALAGFVLQNLAGFSARIYPTAVFMAISVGLVLRSANKSRQDAKPAFQGLAWRLVGGLFLIPFLALTLKFLHIQLLFERVNGAARSGNTQEARQILLRVEGLDDSIPLVQAMLADIDERAGELESAQTRMEAASRLNPSEALFWANLSRLSGRTGKGDPLGFLQKAVALDPASEVFRLRYAQLLASAGRPLEAIVHLDAALRTSPGFDEVYTTYKAVKEFRRNLLGGKR